MSSWIDREITAPAHDGQPRADATHPTRAVDLVLSALALLLIAPVLPAARAFATTARSPRRGRGGEVFDLVEFVPTASRAGRILAALGVRHWWLPLHVLRGDLALVGPRARSPMEPVPPAALSVRPGLFNAWFIRRRTAVAYGSEAQADAADLAARGLRHDLGLLVRGVIAASMPAPAVTACASRVHVGDVTFDNVDMGEALDRLGAMLDGTAAHQVCFVNPACVNIAASDRAYRRVLSRASLVLPDGIGIKIGSDLLGTPLKQNVNGTDLFPRLCDLVQARGARLFLLGGRPGVAEAMVAEIGRRWPHLSIAGVRDGYFGTAQAGAVAAQVRDSGADLLLVARGVPAQDLFVDRFLPLFGVKVAMGVGGLFDFVSGRRARAPQWMREIGLEWTYRLWLEPGRMWRRYVLGNPLFLARVAMQRLGLRHRTAADAAGPVARQGAAEAAAASPPVRAVIFATPVAGDELPVPKGTPTALLTTGCSTSIERVMDRLLHAEIREVDIVASDRPEDLRRLLGDGSRWGLTLRWHLVADPARPYGVFASLGLQGSGRVVIGHADAWPGREALRTMSQSPALQLRMDTGGEGRWTGWAGVQAADLSCLPEDLDFDGLWQVLARGSLPVTLVAEADLVVVRSALDLLRAAASPTDGVDADTPGSWVDMTWGAMSPTARVHPGARLEGPVRIGPGCIVERGAVVGPAVVLGGRVVVSAEAHLSRCVVLPDTYVGPGLELRDAVVAGNRVHHARLGVSLALPMDDALLLPTMPAGAVRVPLVSRALAGLVWLAATPLLAAYEALGRVAGWAPAWQVAPVVHGRDQGGAWQTVPMRCRSTGPLSVVAHAMALLAGTWDIAAGRRAWFGTRPRDPGRWYALRPEWQQILAGAPVGLFHATAWADDPGRLEEARAAADVFAAVRPAWARPWAIARGRWARARCAA